jgi:hypothetical protein
MFKRLLNHQQLEDKILNLYKKNLPPDTYPKSQLRLTIKTDKRGKKKMISLYSNPTV